MRIGEPRMHGVAPAKANDLEPGKAIEGAVATVSTPEEFGKMIASEIARWGAVIKAAGMKPD